MFTIENLMTEVTLEVNEYAKIAEVRAGWFTKLTMDEKISWFKENVDDDGVFDYTVGDIADIVLDLS